MDTLSSSVTSIKVLPLPSTTPRDFYCFKTPNASLHQLPPHFAAKSNSICGRSNSHTLSLKKNPNSPLFSAAQTSSFRSSSTVHRNPAKGYAAALVDIARCNNCLPAVQKDARRFSKLLQNEQIQSAMAMERKKGRVVKELAKGGKFNGLLVGLLKMLMGKNKTEMVSQVLMEFERICDELSGTRVFLVSSTKKMEEDQLFRIARATQKLSGDVNVKIRNLIDDDRNHLHLPSFAA